jgi:transcriptional regulator with XRE-family HTH domain
MKGKNVMYKHTNLYHGTEQWLIKLDEARIKANMSTKQIAEAIGESERMVYRIFSGEAKNPSVNVVRKICRAVGASVNEIFEESGAVIASEEIVSLQGKVDTMSAENDLLRANLSALEARANSLSAENDVLRLEIKHKDEIIALHNYYNALLNKD